MLIIGCGDFARRLTFARVVEAGIPRDGDRLVVAVGANHAQPAIAKWGGELGTLVATGRLKYRESVSQGLDSAPEAFIGLLKGRNFGKQLVKLV